MEVSDGGGGGGGKKSEGIIDIPSLYSRSHSSAPGKGFFAKAERGRMILAI